MSKEEEQILIKVHKEGDELITMVNAEPRVLFGVAMMLVERLSEASQGQLEYNQILDDMKKIEGETLDEKE